LALVVDAPMAHAGADSIVFVVEGPSNALMTCAEADSMALAADAILVQGLNQILWQWMLEQLTRGLSTLPIKWLAYGLLQ
jgi:hypothetical protein